MKIYSCFISFFLISYSISQVSLDFTIEKSKDIGEIENVYISDLGYKIDFELINKADDLYKFEFESKSLLLDTLIFKIQTQKYLYLSKVILDKIYRSSIYPLKLELISYSRFFQPRLYNLVITNDGISQPFLLRRFKRNRCYSRNKSK